MCNPATWAITANTVIWPRLHGHVQSCSMQNHRNLRKLEKAMAVRNSLLEKFSGKFRRCWKILPRFSGSTKCYPCQGFGIFRQGKWLLENRPRLRERCWVFSSETATAFLSSSDNLPAQQTAGRNRCDVMSYVRDGPVTRQRRTRRSSKKVTKIDRHRGRNSLNLTFQIWL